MRIPEEFDEIRPYSPEELPKIFEELLSDSDFIEVIKRYCQILQLRHWPIY